MEAIDDHRGRIAAALAGALAAEPGSSGAQAATEMLGVAESLVAIGSFDLDDLRRHDLTLPSVSGPAALLARVVPYGLATPLDRPRLRRDAYRCAAAAGADEGTAITCVAAALVAADLLRFDPATTAIRVRQSLLEDAPMALLNHLTLLDRSTSLEQPSDDPGAVLQLALSALAWVEGEPPGPVRAVLGEQAQQVVGALAAAFAGAWTGHFQGQLDEALGERVGRTAAGLAALAAVAPA